VLGRLDLETGVFCWVNSGTCRRCSCGGARSSACWTASRACR
jgi:hypothetical protein